MAGYSGKALIDKLGYKPGESVRLLNAPDWFADYVRENGVITVGPRAKADWCEAFFVRHEDATSFADRFVRAAPARGLWVNWPKKSSGVSTDLTEQSFRDLLLPLGWVDTKVCAVDETWSGLKFLRRREASSKR